MAVFDLIMSSLEAIPMEIKGYEIQVQEIETPLPGEPFRFSAFINEQGVIPISFTHMNYTDESIILLYKESKTKETQTNK